MVRPVMKDPIFLARASAPATTEQWSIDTKRVEREVQAKLFSMQDIGYREFQSKLIPDLSIERMIGVRTPQLRDFSKEFGRTAEAAAFMKCLPHTYYEENNLHACLIERILDYDAAISALEEFLPYIDNWATCDMLRPKVFKKNLPRLLEKIRGWLRSDLPFVVRFGLEMLMIHFLDDAFQPEYLELAANVDRKEYYVRMMVSWFFATALAKRYEETVVYLEQYRLPVWVHNKTIQKATESYRISVKKKVFLKSLKIK